MTTARPVCPHCGTIKKSGKSSCCARGGSWFKNCGSTGNAKLDHTWYEGIRVCKTRVQSKKASGRQSNAAQRLNSPNGVVTGNSKSIMTTVNDFVLTSANTSILIPARTPSSTPAYASINTSEVIFTEEYNDTGKSNFKTIAMTPNTIIITLTLI